MSRLLNELKDEYLIEDESETKQDVINDLAGFLNDDLWNETDVEGREFLHELGLQHMVEDVLSELDRGYIEGNAFVIQDIFKEVFYLIMQDDSNYERNKIGGLKMKNLEEVKENFVKVLYEYSQYGNISYEGDVILEFIDEEVIEEYSDVFDLELKEAILDLKEEFDNPDLSDVKIVEEEIGKGLSFRLDGIEFRYVSDKYSVTELRHMFINKISDSKSGALDWVKENAVNYWNEWQIGREIEKEDVSEEKEDKVEEGLEKKVSEWREKLEEIDKDDKININPIKDKGLVVSVFESETEQEHRENPIIKEIDRYVKERGCEGLLDNWNYKSDKSGENTWYSTVTFEDINEKRKKEIKEAKEFKNNIIEKMENIDDVEFIGFKGFKEGVELLFKQETENLDESLEIKDLKSEVDKQVKSVVENYEDSTVELKDVNIGKDEDITRYRFKYNLVK